MLGKCGIAPLKSLTLPRIELSAAAIAVKLAHTFRQGTEYVIDRLFFVLTPALFCAIFRTRLVVTCPLLLTDLNLFIR